MAELTVNQSLHDVLGCNSVSGSRKAILRVSGIDIQEFPQVMDGSGSATVSKDGHQWTIKPWHGGGGFAVASRPETEEEIERERRRMLRSTFVGYFRKDRLMMCQTIAREIQYLTKRLSPNNPPPRAVRRDTQRRIRRLAEIQFALLTWAHADSSLYEQELEHLMFA